MLVHIPKLPYAITFRSTPYLLPADCNTHRAFDAPHIAPEEHCRMLDRMNTERFDIEQVSGE